MERISTKYSERDNSVPIQGQARQSLEIPHVRSSGKQQVTCKSFHSQKYKSTQDT